MFNWFDDDNEAPKGVFHSIDPLPVLDAVDPGLKNLLVTNDRTEGKKDLLGMMKQAEPLSDYALKQVDHVFDLAKYSLKDDDKRNVIDKARKLTFDLLPENDVTRWLSDPNNNASDKSGHFKYLDTDVPNNLAFPLMKSVQSHFMEKDHWPGKRQIPNLVEQLKANAEESPNPLQINDPKPDNRLLAQNRLYTKDDGTPGQIAHPNRLPSGEIHANTAYDFLHQSRETIERHKREYEAKRAAQKQFLFGDHPPDPADKTDLRNQMDLNKQEKLVR